MSGIYKLFASDYRYRGRASYSKKSPFEWKEILSEYVNDPDGLTPINT